MTTGPKSATQMSAAAVIWLAIFLAPLLYFGVGSFFHWLFS